MSGKLVSVVIPVYNGTNYLKEAIDSVLNQTYKNIEIIVINDGSNDEGSTEKIAKSYGDKIQYYYKANGGVASALNEGIKHINGEYFLWLSHDDVFYPDKVQAQVELLEDSKYTVTACSYNLFWDDGRKVEVPIIDFYKEKTMKGPLPVIQAIIQFGGVMFSRDIFDKYGVFDENLRTTQDYEFLFRILRHENCYYDNRILYGIRYHDMQGSVVLPEVKKERKDMYRLFLDSLTKEEKENMYGSEYGFYYEMLLRAWSIEGMDEIVGLCMCELKENKDGVPRDISNDSSAVYIYGSGAYGRRLLFNLRCRNIPVIAFIDKNKKLWGNYIDGIKCISLANVNDKDGKIVIATIYRNEVAKELNSKGIYNCCFKEDYEDSNFSGYPDFESVENTIKEYKKNPYE